MKVWITKYALTDGIFEAEVTESSAAPGCVYETGRGYAQYFHGEGLQWHRTRESAVARAELMRTRKIASLKKQMNRLVGKVFA